jgi:hypothetical protein
METKISNFLFKLDKASNVIEVFEGSEAVRPVGLIRVKENLTEKDFHTESSYWMLENGNQF